MTKIITLILMISLTSFAKEIKKLDFTEARIFAPMKGSTATAGYAIITNTSNKNITLKIEQVVPFKAVETHETTEKSGHMVMQKVENFVIPAKGQLELKPGGNHIMLFEPSHEVKVGEDLNVQFLVDGKPLLIKFKVVSRIENKDAH